MQKGFGNTGRSNKQKSAVDNGPTGWTPQSKSYMASVYFSTLVGLLLVAISQATTSWTIIDNYKDFVHPDEQQGLWQICYGETQSECVPRVGTALFTVIGMIVYTAKADLPRTIDRSRNPYVRKESKIRYGYSYFLGWAGLLMTFMASILALVLRRRSVKLSLLNVKQ
eukprot:gene15188-16754_t